jgi:CRISPR-associated protein Cas8a1/Csx13
MGGGVKGGKRAETGETLAIHLFGLGMTVLHRVGLAGLWMTLRAVEGDAAAVKRLQRTGGSWERSTTSVTLRWTESFFPALFKESFRIDGSGLVWFEGLGRPMGHPQHAIVLQEALLGSFLQHGKTRQADPAGEPRGIISVNVDETSLPLQFHKVATYKHQDATFAPTASNRLAGWQFPGGAVRHVGLGEPATALAEPPDRALALRFAPVGAIYFEVRQRGGSVKPRYALVLPDIQNLEKYSHARQAFLRYGVQQLYVSGAAEAGFRVLTALRAAGAISDLGSAFCRVIGFGTVPWSKQQKTRVDIFTVHAGSERVLRTFELCEQFFPARLVKPPGRRPFWDVPQVPELVARNLSEGRAWWEGFAEFVGRQERRDHVFRYERGGLAKMVEDNEAFPDGPERIFVRACHETWRRRLGQLGDRARREGTPFGDLVSREFERLRVAFSRCKNAATLREAVTTFWARAGGPLPGLQAGWQKILPLLDDWRKARDLVLLALASYQPASKDEAEALEVPDREGGTDR